MEWPTREQSTRLDTVLEGAPELDPHDELRLTQQALAQLRESVVITDALVEEPGPHIVYVNAAFTRMTGWRPDEVVGKNPRILQGPKTTCGRLDRLRAALETGVSFTDEDVNYRKDGSKFYIDWYLEPLRNVRGEITYFVAVQRDVTNASNSRRSCSTRNDSKASACSPAASRTT